MTASETKAVRELVESAKIVCAAAYRIGNFPHCRLALLNAIPAVETLLFVPVAEIWQTNTYPRCTYKLQAKGVAYPRTCEECQLGPCKSGMKP